MAETFFAAIFDERGRDGSSSGLKPEDGWFKHFLQTEIDDECLSGKPENAGESPSEREIGEISERCVKG